jgi:uncharacterized protein YceK
MIKLILCFLVLVFVSGCGTIQTGGGRIQSCGISMKYCAPGP